MVPSYRRVGVADAPALFPADGIFEESLPRLAGITGYGRLGSGIRGPQPGVLNFMADASPPPIVCTLTDADRQDRGAAWRKLLGSGLVERERVPGGIRLIAAPGAAASLVELIDLERECCAWIEFGLSEGREGAVVTLTADGDGEVALAGMFDIEPSAGS